MPLINIGRSTSLVSEAPDGGTLPTKFIGIGASDGSLLQALLVESASNPNLRVASYAGGVRNGITNPHGDGSSNTIQSPIVANFMYEFNGATWDRIRHSMKSIVTGITSNGTGTIQELATTPMSKFHLSVLRTVGASAYEVTIEGSIEGNFWTIIATVSADSGNIEADLVADKPCTRFRYKVVTIGAGNTLSINILAGAR